MNTSLKPRDSNLLWHLDFKSRVPLGTLATQLKISKAQVHRRLHALRERGIINGFSCVLDVSRLGYTSYRFYFNLIGADPKQEERIFNYFVAHDYSLWVVKLLGRWDLEVVLVVRNAAHLNAIIKQAKRDLGDFFVEYNLSMSPLTHHFRRDYLIGGKRRGLFATYVGSEPTVLDIDEIDIGILEVLIQDSKRSNQSIAKSLGVNYHTVQRRISKLEKSGVIQGYRPVLDFHRLGRRYLKVLFKLAAMSQKRESELMNFIAGFSFVIYLTEVLGDWQLEVECEASDNSEVLHMVAAARRKFGAYLHTSDVIEVIDELKLCYLPAGVVKDYKKKIAT